MRYRLLEHTADAMVEVYGATLGERFANAAYALFDQMTDVTKVSPTGEVRLELQADNREQLLVDFLQELLFLHDVQDLVFGEFEVDTDGRRLVAKVRGEPFDEKKHPKRSVVKGVTYHRLEFDDEKKTVTALFDV
ncbi:MAG: protein archease [Candidatus Thermoplasmatota archaeon]|nr:protein archease [Candidatus Thermoplasmatota archaeon]